MVHEAGIPDFGLWLLPALQWFGIIATALISLGVLGGFLISAAQHGPTEGFYRTSREIFNAFLSDVPGFSLQRTLALAWLAVQESIRRRVLFTVFGVFVVIMVFAGWFLDPRNDNPAQLYLSFVLSTSNWLVLLMSIFLSTLSLPNDLKTKTIYTIVTKPVRASEILLGRVIGFAGIGTALILVMGTLSYIFVSRGLTHTHTIEADALEEIRAEDESRRVVGLRGQTSFDASHRHVVDLAVEGTSVSKTQYGHRHAVTRNVDGSFTVGPPEGLLEARNPIYGKLSWLNRDGRSAATGISVGDEWEYRRYVAGGTRSAAIWRFSGITKERFPQGIPLEITLQVFRTYKGDIDKAVLGSIAFRNPDVELDRESAPDLKRFKEFEIDTYNIPLKLKRKPSAERVLTSAKEGKIVEEYDLFEDLVNDRGELEVIVRCVEPGQYYGVAQADVYIRANDGSFLLNYAKCLLSLWLQMLMIVTFGVLFSTFLSGPVAFLASISSLVVGFFMSFIEEVVLGIFNPTAELAYTGGGPLESIIRIMTQQNMQTELEIAPMLDRIIKKIDGWFAAVLYSSTFVIPDFTKFDTVEFVATGFEIPTTVLAIMIMKAFTYAVGSTLLGYFILKTREVAA